MEIYNLIPPDDLPKIILNLFKNCPNEMPHLRKDLLASMRSLLNALNKYREAFVTDIDQFFNDDIIIGTGWTTKETLRPTAYGVIYDLIHHLREKLTMKQLKLALHVYSKTVYDESTSVMIHVMTCRLLLNTSDSFYRAALREKCFHEIRPILYEIFFHYTHKVCRCEPNLLVINFY